MESEDQTVINWEKENILSEELKDEMETMWEIPQIFHFLHMAKEALNIPHLSMYEMERMLMIPRASKQLANIMTCLLSSPIFKTKLRKIPPMPYEFWTNILMHKIKGWFKVYQTKHQDAVKVLETTGVEPEFWNIFPDASLIEGKDFEELSFKQRVWLLKAVCDCVMHGRKTVQEEIMKQRCEDQFEMVLGTDRYGARFIYFPQFIESDLRVYRLCLDNKILSTVTPCETKVEPKTEVKVENIKKETAGKTVRIKRRKSRWRYGTLPSRMKKRAKKHEEENSSDGKCSADSAIGSLVNDDTNFSNASVCSNNNHSDVEAWTSNRLRSMSKNSNESTISRETKCSNAKSSECDTSASSDISGLTVEKMFRGFARNTDNQRSNIKVIRGILHNLTTTIEVGRKTHDEEKSTNDDEVTLDKWIDKVDSSVSREVKRDKSDVDDINLNKTEKIDSRKKRLRRTKQKLVKSDKTLQQKSELLRNERSISEDENEEYIKNSIKIEDAMLDKTNGRQATQKKVEHRWEKSCEKYNVDLESETCLKNDKSEFGNEEEVTLSELRDRLQGGETPDDLQSINSSDVPVSERYNLRKLKTIKTEESKKNAENFKRILTDLSVSSFELVADSVEALRDLVTRFSSEEKDNPSDNCRYTNHSRPACEVRLVKKLLELITSLEGTESILKDSLKKARTKLYKEWTNFKEGVVEDQDQDWSGEGGLGFNWWLLGSQGHPLSCSGETTLQTLSQSALPSPGAQIQAQRSVDEFDEQCNNGHEQQCEPQTQGSNEKQQQSEGTSVSEQQSNQGQDKEQCQERKQIEDIENDSKTEDSERQTGRVLRARGVSSYTEQLYSDEEIDEDQLEGWADLEAVYAASSEPSSTPTVNAPSQTESINDQSEEDSDQDWILPGSRKRKNKRSSTNRRLKSFQHKLHSIRTDLVEESTSSSLGVPSSKEADSTQTKTKESRLIDSGAPKTPSSNSSSNLKVKPVCKLESMDSVHSELDIKDEGPIMESEQNQNVNNYNINVQQGYVVVKTEHAPMTNYYLMQQNPGVSRIVQQSPLMQQGAIIRGTMPHVQQVEQGYCVQGTQSYVVQDSQQNFVPSQQHVVEPHNSRQMIFQQTPQAVGSQQYIGPQSYMQMPYVVGATNPSFMTQPVQQPFNPREHCVNHGMRPNLVPAQNARMTNKFALNRPPPPLTRHNFPHSNGAVIRSNVPIKTHFPRNVGPRTSFPKNSTSQSNGPKVQRKIKKVTDKTSSESSTKKKTTSLIVLSDSDDEIEMIITEKTSTGTSSQQQQQQIQSSSRRSTAQKPIVTSEVTESTSKGVLPPQIIQRMSQGGISITPVKSTPPPVQNTNTQLVVVVNETGSHYALALPNGSKLILTPEQVAQIRASNGGKLIL